MGMSDSIAKFINDLLAESSTAELQRSDLADKFGCVPSQINYVISTRFSPERGYIVESRRGGGGYIRITRVRMEPTQLIMHTVNALDSAIDQRSAAALISNLVSSNAISADCGKLMIAAVSESALRPVDYEKRPSVRASILKQMLLTVIKGI